MISEEPLKNFNIIINNKKICYTDVGDGSPILFIHGNPTSSYLWRNIIPFLQKEGRCVAPDLIGMGGSHKLDNVSKNSYSFFEHRNWLDLIISKLNIKKEVILVLHDWGSVLGFDWAYRNKNKVKGIVYMESIVCPLNWDDWPENAKGIFQAMRSDKGEDLILNRNIFIEKILPSSVIRKLSEKEMAIYRKPFSKIGESRRPTLSWPREIPINGTPKKVVNIVNDYSRWIASSKIPKLFINSNPGSILVGRQREVCRTWLNQKEITVSGIHFIQEDSPKEIGKGILEWKKENF